jgi:hypothetical protein
MVTGTRIKPFAIIGGLVLMIAALVYSVMNRTHEVAPNPPPAVQKTR